MMNMNILVIVFSNTTVGLLSVVILVAVIGHFANESMINFILPIIVVKQIIFFLIPLVIIGFY